MSFNVTADNHAPPESLGISSERLALVDKMIKDTIETHGIAGMSVILARNGKVFYTNASGTLGIGREEPLQLDSIHRIYSMTKVITAVAALMLYEEGAFQLYDPVANYIPELEGLKVLQDGELVEPAQVMIIHHLFTHMSGLGYGHNYRDVPGYAEINPDQATTSHEFIQRLAQLPLLFEPGSNWQYGYSQDVLGVLVERISGQNLGEFMSERIFTPLKMHDTFFQVPEEKLHRVVSNYHWQDGVLHPVSEPPFPQPLRTTLIDAGGAGLFSTAPDYYRFLEMLRRGGSLDGARILGPKTVGFMMLDHVPKRISDANIGPDHNPTLGLGAGHGLGIGVYLDPVRRGVLSSHNEVDWGGVAGTIYWIDREEEIVVVGMSQLFARPFKFRDNLSVLLYQALTESYEYARDTQ